MRSVYRHIEASLPSVTLSADRFLVACGTRPLRRPDVPFDGSRVFDSDQLLWGGVDRVPRDLIVVGAGVIGMEYASMINVIPGTTVTVIDPRDEVLGFADREVTQALCYSMRKNGARFLLGEKVAYGTGSRFRGIGRSCHWGTCGGAVDVVVARSLSETMLVLEARQTTALVSVRPPVGSFPVVPSVVYLSGCSVEPM